MLQIDYIKMSGAGNSFTIVDARDEKYEFSKKQIKDISQEEQTKCDQFIIIRSSFKANCAIEIFNNDGSRVLACGNAVRCGAYVILFVDRVRCVYRTVDRWVGRCVSRW